jgi:hypothetical protein
MMIDTQAEELGELEQIAATDRSRIEMRTLCHVSPVPARACRCGPSSSASADPAAPAIGYFGGVHGLERIGADVVIAYLQSIVQRLRWDTTLHAQFEKLRMVFVPVVNPGGMLLRTRANPNGVDLMRNAPLDAIDKATGADRRPPAWARACPGTAGRRTSRWKWKVAPCAIWSVNCSDMPSALPSIATPASV